ncbi:MAG: HypC/HybG/HupF family hydrogenase formation chaperone [Nocardioidaceae bacterium]
MCLSIPGEVVEISDTDPETATVECTGMQSDINISMLDDLKPGDWVLIHSGFAMSRIDAEEARATLQLLDDFARTTVDAIGPSAKHHSDSMV